MRHISEFLEEGLREYFEERSAILQFDGGLPKEKAEAPAKAETESYGQAIAAWKARKG